MDHVPATGIALETGSIIERGELWILALNRNQNLPGTTMLVAARPLERDVAVERREAFMAQVRHRRRPLPLRGVLAAGCLAILMCAGCGAPAATARTPSAVSSATPSPTTTAPTANPVPNCASVTAPPDTRTTLNIPLPDDTVTYRLPGAAGAGFYLECTPHATQAEISALLNSKLAGAGWRHWNAQTDNTGGCGTEPNAYWQWVKGQQAVGWDFQMVTLPEWHVTFCDLAFATPTS